MTRIRVWDPADDDQLSPRRVLLPRRITACLLLQETGGRVGSGRDTGKISSSPHPHPYPTVTSSYSHLCLTSPSPSPPLSLPSSLPSSGCHPIFIPPHFHPYCILTSPLPLYLTSPLPLTFTPPHSQLTLTHPLLHLLSTTQPVYTQQFLRTYLAPHARVMNIVYGILPPLRHVALLKVSLILSACHVR